MSLDRISNPNKRKDLVSLCISLFFSFFKEFSHWTNHHDRVWNLSWSATEIGDKIVEGWLKRVKRRMMLGLDGMDDVLDNFNIKVSG